MDAKVQTFLDKIKVMAEKTGKAAGRAADAAGKKATELASATRINLQIFDLNTECEVCYKEIGKMVYDLHQGAEVSNDEMDEKIASVDEKQAKIAALREELSGMKSVVTCSQCGRQCSREDTFCSGCGGAL
ncbi:MAG: hypothetical protein Q4C72_03395 [Eubacteriales bacterium]|nr:hypothetical protein [Eubacteriales bacterium]